MRSRKSTSGFILVFMTVFVTCYIMCSCSEEKLDLNYERKTFATRSSNESGEILYPYNHINYANCGIWTLAQLMGCADNQFYYNKIIVAAENAIYWDEEREMEKVNSNELATALNSNALMQIISKMLEMNNNESAIARIQNLETAFPNETILDSIQAQAKILDLAMNPNRAERFRGAIVGLYTMINNRITPHWVRLRDLDLDTYEIIVDDVNAFNPHSSSPYDSRFWLTDVSSLMYRKP